MLYMYFQSLQINLRMGSHYILYVFATLTVCVYTVHCGAENADRPNIVFIIADDLGWNDVSFHGSDQIATPNIDLLAHSGIVLDRYYTHCICTPSRTALLTGKYSHTLGMQGYPLTNSEDRGLAATEKILPQYFKDLGYATHLVGKWHIGNSRTEYLPTMRGFDSHFGHSCGFIDYYEYTLQEDWPTSKVSGMCLYRNLTPAWDVEGYITDVYTEEAKSIIQLHDESQPLFLMVAHNAPHSANEGAILQAPPEEIRAKRYIESPERRIYAAMVKKLDDSVGDITEALLLKGILNKTIIVFISDNGGMTSGVSMNYGSNWPLRGLKMSPFEGGVRVAGVLWSSSLLSNHQWKGYIHVSDWLPTLLSAAGAEPPRDLDGFDLWNDIKLNRPSPRKEMFEIDDYTGYASIISGDYKLITGNVTLNYSNHQGQDLLGIIGNPPPYEGYIKNSKMFSIIESIGRSINVNNVTLKTASRINCKEIEDVTPCYPQNDKLCLYNIIEDPCERKDLSKDYPKLVKQMLNDLHLEKRRMIPRYPIPLRREPISAPKYYNFTWTTFADSF